MRLRGVRDNRGNPMGEIPESVGVTGVDEDDDWMEFNPQIIRCEQIFRFMILRTYLILVLHDTHLK